MYYWMRLRANNAGDREKEYPLLSRSRPNVFHQSCGIARTMLRYLCHLLNKCSDKVRQSFNLELGSFLSTSQNFKLYSIPRVVNTLGMSSRNLDKEISFNLPA